MAITFMAMVAGLVLSLSVALLAEELIFVQVMRVFFVRRTVAGKTGQTEARPVANGSRGLE